jgi:hypothetical protein
MGVMGGMRVSDGGAKKGMPAEFLLGAYNFSMSNRFSYLSRSFSPCLSLALCLSLMRVRAPSLSLSLGRSLCSSLSRARSLAL